MKNWMKKIAAAITQRGPIGYVRRLHSVVQTYHHNMALVGQHVDRQNNELSNALSYIKRATKVHLDVGADLQSTVIVCGKYRGRDHVQVFRIAPGSFEELVGQLRDIQRFSTTEFIDAPGPLDATIKRELKCSPRPA